MNENLIAVTVAFMAVGAAYFRWDDGSLIRMVVTAYLGFLLGSDIPRPVRSNRHEHQTRRLLWSIPSDK